MKILQFPGVDNPSQQEIQKAFDSKNLKKESKTKMQHLCWSCQRNWVCNLSICQDDNTQCEECFLQESEVPDYTNGLTDADLRLYNDFERAFSYIANQTKQSVH